MPKTSNKHPGQKSLEEQQANTQLRVRNSPSDVTIAHDDFVVAFKKAEQAEAILRQPKKYWRIPTRQSSLFSRLTQEDQLFLSAVRMRRALHLPEVVAVNRRDVSHIYGSHALATFVMQKSIPPNFLIRLIEFAAAMQGATIVASRMFEGEDGSITGGIVIAESHVICHIMPTTGGQFALMIDAYTCGNVLDPNVIITTVYQGLSLHTSISKIEQLDFKRGIVGKDPSATRLPPRLLPGIAYDTTPLSAQGMLTFFKNHQHQPKTSYPMLGKHVVGELYCCDQSILNNGHAIVDAMYAAIGEEHWEHIKFTHIIQFKPQGVSVVLMGPGLQITTHPWPELPDNIGPIDIFVSDKCGIDPVKFMQNYAAQVNAGRSYIYSFDRGVYNNGRLEATLHENLTSMRQHKY